MERKGNSFFNFPRSQRNGLIFLLSCFFLFLAGQYMVTRYYQKKKDKAFETAVLQNVKALEKIPVPNEPYYQNQSQKQYNSFKTSAPFEKAENNVVVEINNASAEDLEALPGIGAVYAGRIIKFRESLGGFYNIGQVKEVYGIEPETYNKIKTRLKCDQKKIRKLNINKATVEELDKHPYISPKLAKQIVGYRDKVKPFEKPEDILNLYEMNDSLYQKLSPYIYIP